MLGKGYKAWCTGAEEAITLSHKIVMVMSNAADILNYDEVTFVQKNFDQNWTGNKMQLSADGPILLIILVSSDVYPVEAADIKKDFLAQPPSISGHPGFSTPRQTGARCQSQKKCRQAHASLSSRRHGREDSNHCQRHFCHASSRDAGRD